MTDTAEPMEIESSSSKGAQKSGAGEGSSKATYETPWYER